MKQRTHRFKVVTQTGSNLLAFCLRSSSPVMNRYYSASVSFFCFWPATSRSNPLLFSSVVNNAETSSKFLEEVQNCGKWWNVELSVLLVRDGSLKKLEVEVLLSFAFRISPFLLRLRVPVVRLSSFSFFFSASAVQIVADDESWWMPFFGSSGRYTGFWKKVGKISLRFVHWGLWCTGFWRVWVKTDSVSWVS